MGLTYQRKRERGDGFASHEETLGIYKAYVNGVLINQDTKRGTAQGGDSEIIMDYLNPGPPYTTGKPYTHFKVKSDMDLVLNSGFHSGSREDPYYGTLYESTYNGGWLPSFGSIRPDFTVDDLSHASISGYFGPNYCDPTDLGPSAYNKFKPKMAEADMGVFLGESREIPGMFRTSAKGFVDGFHALGGKQKWKAMPTAFSNQFLNHHFGWVPFISDLSKFIKTATHSAARIAQHRRDNGRWIKRRGLVSLTDGVELVADHSARYPVNPYLVPGSIDSTFHFGQVKDDGKMPITTTTITKTLVTKTWFAGAFRYWIPYLADPESRISTIRSYLDLYGIRISPLLVWNLTPWSWLADWVGNVGDNISNFTSQVLDNCVSKYAYIMQKKSISYGFSSLVRINGNFSKPMTWTYEGSVRARRCASPYGFSVSLPDMTAKRWAILAALGLSRSRLEDSWFS